MSSNLCFSIAIFGTAASLWLGHPGFILPLVIVGACGLVHR